MDILYFILAGIFVGFTVGLTGVGGGSLMTPILLSFGIPPHYAVGTDLLYASVTKSSSVWLHHQQKTINWKIVGLLGLGSIPGSIITIFILHYYFHDADQYGKILTSALGIMLIFTSAVLFLRRFLHKFILQKTTHTRQTNSKAIGITTCIFGLILGVLVTLSSVGAGALGTAVLLILYSNLIAVRIVGTELAHAVPLTFIAGLGHLALGNVDYWLLLSLLIGSLPAVYIGTKAGAKLPDRVLQPILAMVLLLMGIKYVWF